MENDEKIIGNELLENKLVQVGGATLLAAAAVKIGVSTAAFGVMATAKAGVILAGFGPVGWTIGGALAIGGLVQVVCKRLKK